MHESMNRQTILINGANISERQSFYDEIDRILTKDLDWQTGHNLNAFNDLLMGGFGVFEYEEPIKLIWTDFSNCKQRLGDKLTTILIEIIQSHEHVEFETRD